MLQNTYIALTHFNYFIKPKDWERHNIFFTKWGDKVECKEIKLNCNNLTGYYAQNKHNTSILSNEEFNVSIPYVQVYNIMGKQISKKITQLTLSENQVAIENFLQSKVKT